MFAGYKVKMSRKTTAYKNGVQIGSMIGNYQGGHPFPVSGELGRGSPFGRGDSTAVPENHPYHREYKNPQEPPYEKMKPPYSLQLSSPF
jgi:hypothetical protein